MRLVVQRLSGQSVELDIEDDIEQVSQLKGLVFQHWQIPPLCQQLFCGEDLLVDSDKLRDKNTSDGKALLILLVTSTNGPLESLHEAEKLTHDDHSKKLVSALEALVYVGGSLTAAHVYSILENLGGHPCELFAVLKLGQQLSQEVTAEACIGAVFRSTRAHAPWGSRLLAEQRAHFRAACLDFVRSILHADSHDPFHLDVVLEIPRHVLHCPCTGVDLETFARISRLLLNSGQLVSQACMHWQANDVQRFLRALFKASPKQCPEVEDIMSKPTKCESLRACVSALLLKDAFASAREHAMQMLHRFVFQHGDVWVILCVSACLFDAAKLVRRAVPRVLPGLQARPMPLVFGSAAFSKFPDSDVRYSQALIDRDAEAAQRQQYRKNTRRRKRDNRLARHYREQLFDEGAKWIQELALETHDGMELYQDFRRRCGPRTCIRDKAWKFKGGSRWGSSKRIKKYTALKRAHRKGAALARKKMWKADADMDRRCEVEPDG